MVALPIDYVPANPGRKGDDPYLRWAGLESTPE
jgi:hypothetical protein